MCRVWGSAFALLTLLPAEGGGANIQTCASPPARAAADETDCIKSVGFHSGHPTAMPQPESLHSPRSLRLIPPPSCSVKCAELDARETFLEKSVMVSRRMTPADHGMEAKPRQ